MFYSQEAEDRENDMRIALMRNERDRQEEIETIRNLVRAALAALSQKTTHQADIDYAKNLCRQALKKGLNQ